MLRMKGITGMGYKNNEKGRLWSLYCDNPTLEKYRDNVKAATRKGDSGAVLSIRARLLKVYGSESQYYVNDWVTEVKEEEEAQDMKVKDAVWKWRVARNRFYVINEAI